MSSINEIAEEGIIFFVMKEGIILDWKGKMTSYVELS